MKILFYGTKDYDKKHFKAINKEHTIEYVEEGLNPHTAIMRTESGNRSRISG